MNPSEFVVIIFVAFIRFALKKNASTSMAGSFTIKYNISLCTLIAHKTILFENLHRVWMSQWVFFFHFYFHIIYAILLDSQSYVYKDYRRQKNMSNWKYLSFTNSWKLSSTTVKNSNKKTKLFILAIWLLLWAKVNAKDTLK